MSDNLINARFGQGLGEVSAGNLNAFVQTVYNYSTLRNFTPLNNMTVVVLGAETPNDGGQAVYYYSATANGADNNSTIITPNGQGFGPGRWLLLPLAGSGGGGGGGGPVDLWLPEAPLLSELTQFNIGAGTGEITLTFAAGNTSKALSLVGVLPNAGEGEAGPGTGFLGFPIQSGNWRELLVTISAGFGSPNPIGFEFGWGLYDETHDTAFALGFSFQYAPVNVDIYEITDLNNSTCTAQNIVGSTETQIGYAGPFEPTLMHIETDGTNYYWGTSTDSCNPAIFATLPIPGGFTPSHIGIFFGQVTGTLDPNIANGAYTPANHSIFNWDRNVAGRSPCAWAEPASGGGGGGGGGGSVSTVFGRSGAVVAQTGDYTFSMIAGTVASAQLTIATTGVFGAVKPDGTTIQISAGVISTVPGAGTIATPSAPGIVAYDNTTIGLNGSNQLFTIAGPVSSVFGRNGDVVAESGDYTVSQVTGAAPSASPTFTGTVTGPAGTWTSAGLNGVVIGSATPEAASVTTLAAVTVTPNHIVGGGSAPTLAAGTGAGTSPSISLNATAHDLAGIITVIAGSTPATSSTVITLTFAAGFTAAPVVLLTPANAAAAALSSTTQVFGTAGTASFTITSGSAALTGAMTYAWNYAVIG